MTKLIMLSLLIIISEVGVMADSSIKVWVADTLVKVLPTAPVPDAGKAAVQVEAVRNEYESAQIVVTPAADVAKLTVTISPLKGPSPIVPRVEAHFLGFIHIEKGTAETPPEYLIATPPADIPDHLLEDKSVSVKAGTNQPIWLTVYVPKKCEPGTYEGKISIRADSFVSEVPISIKVHPVTLTDERTLYLTNWFSPGNIAKFHGMELWSEPYWKMLEAYARCMADHRQNVVITPIMNLITIRYDAGGNRSFDFSMFDRWVDLFKKAGVIGTIEGGHLGGRGVWEAADFDASMARSFNADGSERPKPSIKTTSDEEREFLSYFLPALQQHLEEKGWLDCYVQHLADEPVTQNAESYKKLRSYVHEFGPKLKTIDAAMCNEIAGSIDIWVPQPQHYENDIKFFEERRKAGDEIWFYTCLSPKGKYLNRFLDYQLIRTRLMHWANYRFGLTGYLHWGFNYWRGDPYTDLQNDWLPPGDSHIVYPGKRGPMSSIRLEALRDGVEDFELLKLLERKDPRKAREICSSVIRSMTDYTMDPNEFRKARAKLIRALVQGGNND
ncbi:MAG TPA: glycoside hydrolase domain-containing protein [Armatimonadota bacterium]|nr:glycoside hydrolase domain-containing protein [Armatimonadota bacterium]